MGKRIDLFYWSERKFLFKDKENYGDLLSKYLVEKISEKPVNWVHPKKIPWYKIRKAHYLAIGSILHHATSYSSVWGSGIIDRKHPVAPAEFLAVRGPQTRRFLEESGYTCPEIYGDPALLLPMFYNPEEQKKYSLGIIPHYNDYEMVERFYSKYDDVIVIDVMTLDIEEVTRKILQCESTVSSSLHGLIVSHAYRIPSLWVEFSNKVFGDGIKYKDYLQSVRLSDYNPPFIGKPSDESELQELIETFPTLPEKEQIEKLQQGLISSCPFF